MAGVGNHGTRTGARGSDAVSAGRSATSVRLADSLGQTYDLDSAGTERLLVAGLILRVRDLLLRELDGVLSELGTSHAKYQVLSIVCSEPDGVQLSEIAARASVHSTTMTATIDRLVRGGLIERRADPGDRRRILAVATREGHNLYRRAHAELAALEYGLSDVDSDTVKSLLEGLDNVALVFEHGAGGPE
ncbi:MarR family winged helix-turn-helix transcriptional regulator [Streptomyces sp. NPDC090075]|uniref:MarR family winged helix-turn-helix transcriptional regulator n=1 Tax=Streptomyces sp. NPDC090075 TaxID=3365937 RepID=UPI003801AED6